MSAYLCPNGELTNILKHETKKEYFITQKKEIKSYEVVYWKMGK